MDQVTTDYGIRTIKWNRGKTNQFLLNGKPVFINGIAEYEHLLGNSHAFSATEIKSRATQIKQLGFNAFRDGHQHIISGIKIIGIAWDCFGGHSFLRMSGMIQRNLEMV